MFKLISKIIFTILCPKFFLFICTYRFPISCFQGAAKKEKSGRKSAQSKAQDEKMQIHSESQRMVRGEIKNEET